MKELTEQEILNNWQKFNNIVETTFTGDRRDKISKLLEAFQDRMILAPASYKEHYHSAHPGGYMEHVLNVYHIAMDLYNIWTKYSSQIDYTIEELTLIALFHDLGKLGDVNEEFYLPQDNDWRKNNMGEIYKINEKVTNMNGADRSLYLLQEFGIHLSQNEWITIKIHEGLYDEANTYYLKTTSDNNVIKSNLPHLIHQADVIASRIEYEQWKHIYRLDSPKMIQKTGKREYPIKKTSTDTISQSGNNVLNSFFDSKSSYEPFPDIDSLFEDNKKEK